MESHVPIIPISGIAEARAILLYILEKYRMVGSYALLIWLNPVCVPLAEGNSFLTQIKAHDGNTTTCMLSLPSHCHHGTCHFLTTYYDNDTSTRIYIYMCRVCGNLGVALSEEECGQDTSILGVPWPLSQRFLVRRWASKRYIPDHCRQVDRMYPTFILHHKLWNCCRLKIFVITWNHKNLTSITNCEVTEATTGDKKHRPCKKYNLEEWCQIGLHLWQDTTPIAGDQNVLVNMIALNAASLLVKACPH